MSTETFFTLAKYKQNYDRLRDEFVDAYEDNDEEEFISLQIEWYQRCLENTRLERGFVGDTIGWFPKSILDGNGVVWEVNEKIRNENGGIDQIAAQNLSVSFGKILNFLKQELNKPKAKLTAAGAMLYHFVLQKSKLEPFFPDGGKKKAIESLTLRYGLSYDNLKNKYNVIMPSDGKRGYSKKDAEAVRNLIITHNPTALTTFENITKHILF